MFQSWLVMSMRKRRGGVTSRCFKFSGNGQNGGMNMYIYCGNRIGNQYAKSKHVVGAPLASLSIKYRIDRTTYGIENSHCKAYFANKEKQI